MTGNASGPEDTATGETPGPRVVIKKYANRRLYNTASSSYVTLEHLSEMVKQGQDFVVFDAKSNEDITRQVLTQIIFEEESKGQTLLPIQFLRQLIGYYGDQMQMFLPSYLQMSLENFAQQQERLRTQFIGPALGVPAFEDQIRQNMALFDRAMKMFVPYAMARPGEEPKAEPAKGEDESLTDLKRQVEAMRAQLDKLSKK